MNKTALITGASQGIGASIARKLAADGFSVAINCRTQESGAQVKAECETFGVEAECFVADVSDFSACESMVKAIKERFGRIDVLVNNAGITKDGLIARMTEEQFDIVTNVNYKSVFNMIRHVSPIMMKQRSGRIINIAWPAIDDTLAACMWGKANFGVGKCRQDEIVHFPGSGAEAGYIVHSLG